jgi:hypothetical protein
LRTSFRSTRFSNLALVSLLGWMAGCAGCTSDAPVTTVPPPNLTATPAEPASPEPAPAGQPSADQNSQLAADQSSAAESANAPLNLRPLTEQELSEGWLSLFDGQTLFGWEAASDADWRVDQGTIVVSAGEKGLLCTTTQFDDYLLKLDFRSAKGTNSGIFLATPKTPQDPAADCYELNIADSDNPFPTGSLVKRKKVEGNFDSDEWQSFEIRVEDGRVQVQLDGQPVMDYTDPRPLGRGHIGLQLNSGRVAFRNLKLKPLRPAAIFNGRDLTGWKEYPEMASKFRVTDEGLLHVKDGKGQLETERTYADFVLQLECQTHADHLNSGVFFRCIPGQVMMGYEAQIHNGFKDGDRTQPLDFGTGAIFRRKPARVVASDDQQWFFMTLVADGPHMATWVNGLQVCDWVDERPADENPRNGLRLEAGTIMIQGHDPTTDISFRNLRAADLHERTAPPNVAP